MYYVINPDTLNKDVKPSSFNHPNTEKKMLYFD